MCGVPAETCCERCGLPVCPDHRPGADRRCSDCEATYRRRRPARLLFYLAGLVSASVALVVGLFFLVVATGGGALGVAPLILFGSFPVILHWLEHRARAHFRAERRAVAALPPARLVR
jgi:predicted nucleic acid-binding Zn ribbon protein